MKSYAIITTFPNPFKEESGVVIYTRVEGKGGKTSSQLLSADPHVFLAT